MSKRPKVPYAKGRKFCIFCGAPADSEEHIWPAWAKDILPRGGYHERLIFAGTWRRRGRPIRHRRGQGPAISTRIKRVCKACNNGWMSQFETKVRFHLTRLIQGQRIILNAEAKRALAQYLSYKMLLVDWFTEEPIIPPERAHEFYRTKVPPPGLKIWIFQCVEGSWRCELHTQAIGIAVRVTPVGQPWTPTTSPPNTKSFAIGFGDLFVFAIASAQADFDFDLNRAECVTLWPLTDAPLVWPFHHPILSGEAEFIATILDRFVEG